MVLGMGMDWKEIFLIAAGLILLAEEAGSLLSHRPRRGAEHRWHLG